MYLVVVMQKKKKNTGQDIRTEKYFFFHRLSINYVRDKIVHIGKTYNIIMENNQQ